MRVTGEPDYTQEVHATPFGEWKWEVFRDGVFFDAGYEDAKSAAEAVAFARCRRARREDRKR